MSSGPTIPSTPISTPAPARATPRFAERRVLLVEDDPPESRRVLEFLRADAMQVTAVPDYHAAVLVLASFTPDIALVNLTLPRESGYELCEWMRAQPHLRGVPIVVLGERGSPEDLAYAEEVGANAFLKKPFSRAELAEYLGAMLDGPWVSRPNGVLLLCAYSRP